MLRNVGKQCQELQLLLVIGEWYKNAAADPRSLYTLILMVGLLARLADFIESVPVRSHFRNRKPRDR